HTVHTQNKLAQDHLLLAEQQKLDVARQISTNYLQQLAIEQKKLEKNSSLQNLDQSLSERHHSITKSNLPNIYKFNKSFVMKL
ncbi:unnamed protein product, partial [Rotaria sp. Silwood2]